jgi:hypothetical protein
LLDLAAEPSDQELFAVLQRQHPCSRPNDNRSTMSRRTRVAAAVSAVVLAAGFVASYATAPASAATDPGQGNAIAQTQKIDPKAGGLSLGVTFGQSLAGHQNEVAQASSQAINLGVIGTTIGGEGCDGSAPTYPSDQQPQPLRIDSRDKDADKGKTETENGAFEKSVKANSTPYGEAVTTTAPYSIAGVLKVGGGTATTHSGLVKDQREASAVVEISSLDLAGVIHLGSLRWEALYRSTGDKKVSGTFTIGSASANGQALPTNDPSKTLDQANAALKLLGVQLVPPVAHESGGVLFVSPLAIAVVPNSQRDAIAGAVIGGIQPIRKALTDALLEQSCKNASYITIFDLVVGSVTGAGAFALSLGGVQASSSVIPKNGFSLGDAQYSLGGGAAGGGAPLSFDTAGGSGSTSFSGTAPSASSGGSSTGGDGSSAGTPVATKTASAFKGTRGGGLAAAGVGALGLLAALAEGDRRKMRRAQREIPDSEE